MSRPGRPPRSQQRLLTPEDEALWNSVAHSFEPVRKKPRIPSVEIEPTLEKGSTPPVPPRLAAKLETAHPAPPPPPRQIESIERIGHKAPPLADFDRRQARRIASGRIEVESRIDLHGMRASEAHMALRAFLFRSYARGQRNLLVITGKGSSVDLRDRPFDLSDRSERGVLRRSVPMWLADPDLRAIVVSFTQAHARHGGEGAIYVQLRSNRRGGDHD